MLYGNKIENRITFKIKTGYHLEILIRETMKLLGSTKSKITKDEIGENVPHLEITEIMLVNCNIVNNDYQQDSRVLYTFQSHHQLQYTQDFGLLKQHVTLVRFDYNSKSSSAAVCTGLWPVKGTCHFGAFRL